MAADKEQVGKELLALMDEGMAAVKVAMDDEDYVTKAASKRPQETYVEPQIAVPKVIDGLALRIVEATQGDAEMFWLLKMRMVAAADIVDLVATWVEYPDDVLTFPTN